MTRMLFSRLSVCYSVFMDTFPAWKTVFGSFVVGFLIVLGLGQLFVWAVGR